MSTLIWGATFPATKSALDEIDPFAFLFLRFLLGTMITLGLFGILGWQIQCDRVLIRRTIFATVFLFLGYATQTVGLRYTTASNSAFITALYVVLVPLFTLRLDSRIWGAAGLAALGLWLLIKPSVDLNLGDLLSLACAIAFAAHIICLETYTRCGDSRSLFLWQLVWMVAAMGTASVWEGGFKNGLPITPALTVGLVITGILATGAFAVQVWAQQQMPAQSVALVFSLEPAYAAWLSWYFLGERLDGVGWMGSGLILMAVLVGAWEPSRKDTSEKVMNTAS